MAGFALVMHERHRVLFFPAVVLLLLCGMASASARALTSPARSYAPTHQIEFAAYPVGDDLLPPESRNGLFVANNPVNLVDPYGLFAPAPVLPAIAGGAAAGIGAAGAAAGVAAAGVGVGIGIGINNIPIGDGRNVGDALADFVYDNIVEPIQNSGRNERGQRNYLNDEAARLARQNGTDVCTELAKMAAEEKSRGRDSCSKTLNDIKQAQKAAGCRNSNK